MIAVLVVVALLILVAYQFHRLMSAEQEAVAASNRVASARHLADSGLHAVAFWLSHPYTKGISDDEGSMLVFEPLVFDNPNLFHLQPVLSADGLPRGYFSIVSPADPEDGAGFLQQAFRFGVEDEGGKINLNALLQLDRSGRRAREILQKIPGLEDEQVVQAIINWTRQPQANAETGETGTDGLSQYYAEMGYQPKYGPYESLEELLFVYGLNARLLLGNDLNRNGKLDPSEDPSNGAIDRGLSRLLTVYSRERNVDFQGNPRININETLQQYNQRTQQTLTDEQFNLEVHKKLIEAVGEEMADFLMAYRIYGSGSRSRVSFRVFDVTGELRLVSDSSLAFDQAVRFFARAELQPDEEVEEGQLKTEDIDFTRPARQQLNSLYDLIGGQVQITKEGQRRATRYRSPLQQDNKDGLRALLPAVFDKITTRAELELPARVNINTAPREVLLAFPDMTEDVVYQILQARPTGDLDQAQAAIYRTPTWLITEAGFEPTMVRQFEQYFTTRSQVYRVQVIGYYELGGPSVRLEAVIDTNYGRPRFLYWRDLTELGRGYDFNTYVGPTR